MLPKFSKEKIKLMSKSYIQKYYTFLIQSISLTISNFLLITKDYTSNSFGIINDEEDYIYTNNRWHLYICPYIKVNDILLIKSKLREILPKDKYFELSIETYFNTFMV